MKGAVGRSLSLPEHCEGSCAELRTQLYIGIEAGILDDKIAGCFIAEGVELSRMLQGLINRLRP